MPELFLLRHADAENHTGDDHERPLSPRGEAEAAAICESLRSCGVLPSLVLCSSALRTRETLEALSAAGVFAAAPSDGALVAEIEDGLYLASAAQMLRRLREIPPQTPSALLIAHNPGIHELAVLLAGEGDRDAYDTLRRGMPPAALCRLAFDREWAELAPSVARLVSYNFPG